jgi:hypothetical protein
MFSQLRLFSEERCDQLLGSLRSFALLQGCDKPRTSWILLLMLPSSLARTTLASEHVGPQRSQESACSDDRRKAQNGDDRSAMSAGMWWL